MQIAVFHLTRIYGVTVARRDTFGGKLPFAATPLYNS